MTRSRNTRIPNTRIPHNGSEMRDLLPLRKHIPCAPASQTPLGSTPATSPNHNGSESREMLPLRKHITVHTRVTDTSRTDTGHSTQPQRQGIAGNAAVAEAHLRTHPRHRHLSGRHRLQHPTTTAQKYGICCRCSTRKGKNGITWLHQSTILILLPKEYRFPAKSRLLPKECTRRIHATGTQKAIFPGHLSFTPSEGVLLSRKIPTPSEGVHKAHTRHRHTEGHFPRTPFHKEKPSHAGSRYSTISWNRYLRALTSLGSLGSISLPLSSVMLMPVTSMPEVTKPIGSSM